MESVLAVLVVVVAVAAAARSTWSPCGWSMLSTVTPLAERSRGHRFATTAAWFVVGGIAGGVTLGAGMAALAAVVAAVDPSTTAIATIALVAAAVAAAHDASLFGFHVPAHTRQVNERWLDRYRGWVYGLGFGWQIGVGVATYITTAGVYLTIVYGALTGEPAAAMALGVLFGTVRGLAVLLGARLTSPERLRAFHRRFDAAGVVSRRIVIGIECAAVVVFAAAGFGPAAAIAVLTTTAATIAATAGRARQPHRALTAASTRAP